MNLKLRLEPASFNNSKFGNEKLCAVVMFPNCISTTTNKPFKWFPTYKQLKKMLAYVEKISWKPKDLKRKSQGGNNNIC